MTREQAINYLISSGFTQEQVCEVVRALTYEPTTKNNLGVDCISRQAVLEQAYAYGNGLEPDGYCVNVEDIQALPSVTQGYDKANEEWLDRIDKIRAEIETKYGQCDICEYFEDYDYEENDISEYRPIGNIADILQIIDKYKAETKETDGTNKQA